jgi:hypothetical protein
MRVKRTDTLPHTPTHPPFNVSISEDAVRTEVSLDIWQTGQKKDITINIKGDIRLGSTVSKL